MDGFYSIIGLNVKFTPGGVIFLFDYFYGGHLCH